MCFGYKEHKLNSIIYRLFFGERLGPPKLCLAYQIRNMKLYYNGKGYPVKWKSLMNKDMWYNMEPVKIKFTLPESVYKAILIDIKLNKGFATIRWSSM